MSLILAVLCAFIYCTDNYRITKASTEAITRNIEVSQKEIDYQSIFDEFEDGKLETVDSITTFEGVKTFDLADFEELDLVAVSETGETPKLQVKYNYAYDSETNIITLTANLIGDDGEPLIDTMIGMAFVNEQGKLDAVFDCDGEYILLSELKDADMIENCGWFKNAWKKVKNAVKKVTNTVVGKVGAVLTVAVPLVVGVIAGIAAAPVLPIIATGALVGAGIAAGTAAISTYQQDGKVDWETVGICAGVGGAVGALASGVAYGITSLIKSATQVSNALKSVESNRRTHILQDKHGWSTLGDNTWDTASEAIKHTLKNGSVASYQAGNQIVTATYKGQTVQVVVREVDKVLRIVDAWIKFL